MKISIITTTFNSEKTIRDTLDSILRQSYSNYELIIIDGKSNDNTLSIIKEYQTKFKGRLRYISEEDKGIYDAMNKGILIAQGDIIGILNSDDFYTTDSILLSIADAFKRNNIDAVYGDVHFVSPDNLTKCIRYYSSKIFKPHLMKLGFMPAHPTFYAKKEIFASCGLYKDNYKIAADFEFLLRVIYIHKIKTLYLPIDMVTMRTGGASTSGFKSYKLIMNEHIRAFKENNLYTNKLILSLRYFYKIFELINKTKKQ